MWCGVGRPFVFRQIERAAHVNADMIKVDPKSSLFVVFSLCISKCLCFCSTDATNVNDDVFCSSKTTFSIG